MLPFNHFISILFWCCFILYVMTTQAEPVQTKPLAQAEPALIEALEKDVKMLSHTIGDRSSFQYAALQQAILYIQQRLSNTGLIAKHQTYEVQDKKFTNLVFEKPGKENLPIILTGAHYDTCDNPGADDNTSGVAVLLALAEALANYENQHPLQFVFFTLEEPPYFRTESMGSRKYAKFLAQQHVQVKLAIILEMVGFYSDEPIQRYPLDMLKALYPAEGNYLAIASSLSHTIPCTQFYHILKQQSAIPLYIWLTPESIDIHLSDHASFWEQGYPALMITDTAFYRNPNYHEATDTYDTLNYPKMALFTQALIQTMQNWDKKR